MNASTKRDIEQEIASSREALAALKAAPWEGVPPERRSEMREREEALSTRLLELPEELRVQSVRAFYALPA